MNDGVCLWSKRWKKRTSNRHSHQGRRGEAQRNSNVFLWLEKYSFPRWAELRRRRWMVVLRYDRQTYSSNARILFRCWLGLTWLPGWCDGVISTCSQQQHQSQRWIEYYDYILYIHIWMLKVYQKINSCSSGWRSCIRCDPRDLFTARVLSKEYIG